MAGYAIQLQDVTATDPVVPALPVGVPEPVFAFFYGDAAIGINRAVGGAPFVDIGSGPVYSADSARFTPYTNALQTPVNCVHTGMTLMAVWKRVSSGTGAFNRIFSGDPVTLPTPTFNFLVAGSQLELSGTNPAGTASLAISGDLDEYRFIAGALGDNLPTTIYNLTDDTESTNGPASTVLYDTLPSSFIELCSGTAAGPTRPSDLIWGAIVTQRLLKAQIDAYYASIRAMCSLIPALQSHTF